MDHGRNGVDRGRSYRRQWFRYVLHAGSNCRVYVVFCVWGGSLQWLGTSDGEDEGFRLLREEDGGSE
ncbi:hypothetical protein GE21DRAFT_1292429 [Neurospora crassa]|nr:hypothetical protein GE21DRAFT_1292429 [Neurospora crassa]